MDIEVEISDIRRKVDVQPIKNALMKVRAIHGVTYRWKDSTVRGAGVIAQEMMAVMPEVVGRDEEGYLTVASGQVIGLLIEAIKELQAEIESLQRKLEE